MNRKAVMNAKIEALKKQKSMIKDRGGKQKTT